MLMPWPPSQAYHYKQIHLFTCVRVVMCVIVDVCSCVCVYLCELKRPGGGGYYHMITWGKATAM